MLRLMLGVMVWLATLGAIAAFTTPALRSLRDRRPPAGVEQSLLVHARRVAANDAMYREPEAATSALVMPGFPFAASVLGARARPARAMSLAIVFLAALLMAAIVFDETGNRTAAAASAAILVFGGGFLAGPPGEAQAESMALVFVLAGFLTMRILGEFVGTLAGMLLLSAACFTHVLAVPFVLAAFGHAMVRSWRARLGTTLGTAVFFATAYVLLSRELGPWFNYSAWDGVIRTFHWDPAAIRHLVSHDLLGTFGVLTLTVVLSFALPVKPWQGSVGVWLWLGVGAILASLIATQSPLFADRALLPAIAALAVAGPVAIDRMVRHISTLPTSEEWGGRGVLYAALMLQFFQLFMAVPSTALTR